MATISWNKMATQMGEDAQKAAEAKAAAEELAKAQIKLEPEVQLPAPEMVEVENEKDEDEKEAHDPENLPQNVEETDDTNLAAPEKSTKKIKSLIVDSSALIQNIPVDKFADKLYSIPEIISEVRDKMTRIRLQALPFDIEWREPSRESVQKVSTVAKSLGDYDNLSKVDLRLLALALMIEEENLGHEIDLASLEPRSNNATGDVTVRTGAKKNRKKKNKLPGWGSFDDDFMKPKAENPTKMDENMNEVPEEPESPKIEHAPRPKAERISEKGWITPANIAQKTGKIGNNEITKNLNTACATCDFSMQNVLLKLNINLIGREGKLVKNVRSWALRCCICFEITHDMSKIFCPKCGHRHCLKRVPYQVGKNGKKTYFLSKKKNPKCMNQRGLRYSIPALKGGKHNNDPLLCEGQIINYDRVSKKTLKKQNQGLGDGDDLDMPFAMHDVGSRAAFKGNASQRKKYDGGINDITAQQMRNGYGVGNNQKKVKKAKGK